MGFLDKKNDITSLNVSSGVKKQAEAAFNSMYELVDLKGGGLLVELMKQASKTKNFAEVDQAIREKVGPYLYNNGEGKMVHIAYMVLQRNRDRPRNKLLPPLRNLEDPEEFDIAKYVATIQDKDPTKYKEVCWDLDKRGNVGETTLHLCLLSATALHSDLAKRLLRIYPKLINDVYLNDEYYGENVLHIAIVNEDPAMVKYLLDNGANFHERCIGSFMCPEDQKGSRSDTLNQECVEVNLNTNYEGYVYWGEYPLSFAACLGQEECYRLMLAKGANPNLQDMNGNTVLHLLVLHDKMQAFNMAYELGAILNIRNKQDLTPLTLAAKLARSELFFHILKIDREIYWQLGSVTCAAYALRGIDTIDTTTGGIDKNSVLNLVVFGDLEAHLELLDDVVIDLLHAKWNTFVKFKFYQQFCLFSIYFLFSLICFTMRPTLETTTMTTVTTPASTSLAADFATFETSTSILSMLNATTPSDPPLTTPGLVLLTRPDLSALTASNSTDYPTIGLESDAEVLPEVSPIGQSNMELNVETTTARDFLRDVMPNRNDMACFLSKYETLKDYIRLGAEVAVVLGAVVYLMDAGREASFLGKHMFFENLATAPSRVMFLVSCIMVLIMALMRALCLREAEDIIAVMIMLTTAPYFLFFCRGFKKVGPFVVMIYRMILGDLLRFVTIYLVFVLGFSQAYYIVFQSYKPGDSGKPNPMGTPMEANLAMFLISLANFESYYEAMPRTDHESLAKVLFVCYIGIAGILLINMLIAMMGNTYTKIAETRNEWQRQWARIVLVVERGVNPTERLKLQQLYSQKMFDGRIAFVLRQTQTDEDKEENKELDEMRTYHKRSVDRRAKMFAQAGTNAVNAAVENKNGLTRP